jgi:alkylation response protein AidB-like acyl-CoA dehydrogenase
MVTNLPASDQRVMLEQTLERFLRESYSLTQRKSVLQAQTGYSREHWKFFAETGLLGLPFDEADGGFDGSLADVMSVMRLLGQGLVLEPYFACIVVAGRLLARSGNAAQKERWLTPLIAGEHLVGLAHVERGERARNEVRQTRIGNTADGLRLDGVKSFVPVAQSLDAMLVTARGADDALCICVVPVVSEGVSIRSWRSVDGHLVGDVTFSNVAVSAEAILQPQNAEAALTRVLTYATAALCAEATGCMRALLGMTVDYASSRKQFGRPIASFQALKHRLVDCYASCEQADAMLELAADETNSDWPDDVAAAKAFIGEHGARVGHEAIQLHGAMGLTDELAVGHCHKRIVAISMLFGDQDAQTDRFIERSSFTDHRTRSSALSWETLLSSDEQSFRRQVREFLADNLSAELRQAVRRQTVTFAEKDVAVAWQKLLNSKGWLAPHWPPEVGGTGWTPVERFLFEYECALAGAPEQIPMGFRYVGPVIVQFGSEWQKSFFLPKLLASEHYWAQGFSEPGAGSDLAAIKTTAVLQGEHYVVNGSKMWTTHAHYADWLFCIARTSQSDKPQEGITFLLIDMRSPGVSVEPIPLLTVDHEVNQVFLDNVHVPVTHVVGEPGHGWQYAKFLLEFERGGTVFCGRLRYQLNQVKELINTTTPALWTDRVFTHRIARLEHRLMALEALEFAMARAMRQGRAPGVRGSTSKLLSSELQKDIAEAGMHAAGYGGLELVPVRPLSGPRAPEFPGCDLEAVAMPRYLNLRAASIYGGSSEIQREIIAKHVLGLS